MEYTIIEISPLVTLDDKKRVTTLGFAFIDSDGKTMVQCYGTNKRDLIIEYLKS